MRAVILICLLFLIPLTYGQDPKYRTSYGRYINPKDTIGVLNIFVSIHYDITPDQNPYSGSEKPTPHWEDSGLPNSINTHWPDYVTDYMDTEYDPENIHGYFTRRIAEASFNNLIVIGDFMSVTVAQSYITDNDSTGTFDLMHLIESTFSLINELGGLQTLFNNNNIAYYDGSLELEKAFKIKTGFRNNCFDLVQMLVRNSTQDYGGLGNGGIVIVECQELLIDTIRHGIDILSVHGAYGNKNLGNPDDVTGDIHEFAHLLLGDNRMHMGGGGPLNLGYNLTTFSDNSGWSLIGSAGSCLISCNGYERARLGWKHSNSPDFYVAAGNENADIQRSDGQKSFVLRDFITYGDAIRIKIPEVDPGALNQYIWIENHQIHKNDKIEFPKKWTLPCKDDGIPGVYMYYQVGKDTDTASTSLNQLDPYITDHLIPICADGNWDISTDWKSLDYNNCGNYSLKPVQNYYQENPFTGTNDLRSHYFNSQPLQTIKWNEYKGRELIKYKDGVITKKWANTGDNEDAFQVGDYLSICTNPAPVNVITYYHKRGTEGEILKHTLDIFKDNRRIYLTGLRIDIHHIHEGMFKVDIRWDDYNITNDVRWAGNIVLNEFLYVNPNNTITIAQNFTPDRHNRQRYTGLFAVPSLFTCTENSLFKLEDSSEVILKESSTFLLEEGAVLEISNNAIFSVRPGSSLILKTGSQTVIKGNGRIEIEPGGYICFEPGVQLVHEDMLSLINIKSGASLGRNSFVTPEADCITDFSSIREMISGDGSVNNKSRLFQNIPNPFSGETTISYYIDDGVKHASLYIYSSQGRLVKIINIEDRGMAQTILNKNGLKAGMYYYSLETDNIFIDRKQMILDF